MANECIPLFRPGADVTCQTTGAVVGKTFVDISATRDATTGLIKVATAAASTTNKAFGVATFDAASGGRVTVIKGPGQILPVTAGGAIAFNAEVEVGASGRAVTRTTGRAVGRAVEAGTNGNDVFIELF
jgi:hypothetical protein